MRLLLLSTGGPPKRFLRHARKELQEFLAGRRKIGFVTAASFHDEEGYLRRARTFFRTIGIRVEHVRWGSPPKSLDHLDAIMVGGGNTFLLLQRLRAFGLLGQIRRAVRSGLPYVGASAGSNIAGPNIRTTNDWNVVGLRNLTALELVPWNINPHYPRAPRAEKGRARFSETRDQRIGEFHAAEDERSRRLNTNPVVGIEEAAGIWVDDNEATVRGTALGPGRARWFEPDMKPQWVRPGKRLPIWGARRR